MDQRLEIAIERAHQQRRWGELEPERVGAVAAEVEVGPLDRDAAGFPVPPGERGPRHVLGPRDQPGGDRVEVLVGQVARLRCGVEEPHGVRAALVEDVARTVVALAREERVDRAADIAVKPLEKLGEFGSVSVMLA